MADEYIFNEPKAGDHLVVAAAPGQSFQITFPTDHCNIEIAKDSGDLVFTHDNGGSIRVSGFASLPPADMPLIVLQDGTAVAGGDLVQVMLHSNDLEPGLSAAGPEFSDGLVGGNFLGEKHFVEPSLLHDDSSASGHAYISPVVAAIGDKFAEIGSLQANNGEALNNGHTGDGNQLSSVKSEIITLEEIFPSDDTHIDASGRRIHIDSFEGLLHLLAEREHGKEIQPESSTPGVVHDPFWESANHIPMGTNFGTGSSTFAVLATEKVYYSESVAFNSFPDLNRFQHLASSEESELEFLHRTTS